MAEFHLLTELRSWWNARSATEEAEQFVQNDILKAFGGISMKQNFSE
jgi:hypothetical protein